ncbi:MAG: oligosaccharide flippase family protein [Bacteroidaceae bacterium]|nr:oligosaccharide flippase family protein [Bacteroidaceae bacterium]
MADNLKNKTAKGLVWGLFNQGAMQVLNLVFGIILARKLTPDDYGIVGVLAVFTMIAQELQTAGFTQALINLKEPQHRDYSSVFWFNITMSAFMYLVLFISAPLIADFFHEPRLLWASRFVFLAFFISSFGIVANAYMTKHLMMKQMAVIGVVSLLCSGTVGIVLAYLKFSYWALAWQQIVYITVYNIGRYIVVPFRPSFHFSIEPIRKMYRFAFNMMLTNIVNSLSMKILTFIFGRTMPMAQVGNYTQADKWNVTASDTIRCAVNNVAQPVLAEVRSDKERTLRVLRKMMRFASFISFPAMFGLALVSEEFILVTIGEKWRASAALLGLLAVGGSLLPHYALMKNIVISHGRSVLYMWLCVVQIVFQIAIALGFARFGMYNVVLAFVVYTILYFFVWHYFTRPITGYTLFALLKDIVPFALIALVTMVITYYATAFITNLKLLLVARAVLAAIIYIGILKIIKAEELNEAVKYITPPQPSPQGEGALKIDSSAKNNTSKTNYKAPSPCREGWGGGSCSSFISSIRFPLICIVVFIHTDLSDIYMAGRQIVSAGEYMGYETFRHFLQQIFLLAVPMFFAISGFLFFSWQEKFTKAVYFSKIRRRIKTLLVPYLLWNLIVLAVNTLGPLLLPSLAAGRGAALADYDLSRLLMAFWDNGGGKPVCIQLWFLRDLIVTCLLSPIIIYGIDKAKHWFVIVLALLFVADILPNITGLNIAACFPFALGAWYRKQFYAKKTLDEPITLLPKGISLLLAALYLALISYITFLAEEQSPIRLMRLSILLGLPLLLTVAAKACGFRWKKVISDSTFFVFGSHMLLLSFAERHIVCAIPHSDITLSVAYILIPLLVIALCVIASACLQKLCRPLWSALTGGR